MHTGNGSPTAICYSRLNVFREAHRHSYRRRNARVSTRLFAPSSNQPVNSGIRCVGLGDSFDGLIEPTGREFSQRDVRGIMRLGGTIRHHQPRQSVRLSHQYQRGVKDYSDRCIGGCSTAWDSMRWSSLAATARWVSRTVRAEGHSHRRGCRRRSTTTSSVRRTTSLRHRRRVCDRCDRSPAISTARSPSPHHGGRGHGPLCRWIALYAGVAGGADAILIPELPFDLATVAEKLRERDRSAHFQHRRGRRSAFPKGGKLALIEEAGAGKVERLGGIAARVADALAARRSEKRAPSCSAT